MTISIMTENNKQQLKECLNSIYNFTKEISFEIYVIDNNSNDGTKDMISNTYKEIKLITYEKRTSFALGHNHILKIAKGEYIVILNDDTVILKDSFEKMLNFLRENPDAGAVGPKMKGGDSHYQQSAFKFPNILDLFTDYFFNKIRPKNKLSALYENIELVTNPKEVDWLLGACLVIPHKVIKKIGYLDENFSPVYMEDADFSKRIKDAGYKVIYYPEAEIIHYGAQTTQKQKLFMEKILYKNRLKFFKKHYGHIYYLFSRFVLYIATGCNIIFDTVRFLFLRISREKLLHNLYEYIYISNLK